MKRLKNLTKKIIIENRTELEDEFLLAKAYEIMCQPELIPGIRDMTNCCPIPFNKYVCIWKRYKSGTERLLFLEDKEIE